MRDPLSPGWRIVVWPLTALAFVGAALLIRKWALSTPVAPLGLLDLEFASTQTRVNQIVAAWDLKKARSEAIRVTYLDVVFIILYSTSLSLSTVAAAGALKGRHWPLARAGRALAWGQSGTLGFGGGENASMLWQLYRAPSVTGPWARITVICAVCKWTLALAGALYSLYGAIAWITAPGTTETCTDR